MTFSPRVASLCLSATVLATLLAGCVVREQTTVYERPHREYVEAPPPQVVYAPAPAPVVVAPAPVVVAPAPAPIVVEQPAVIVVHRPPPVVPVEIRPRPPGREFIWVPGYYRARGEAWEWVPGGYQRPPRPGAVWVEPRYESRGTEVHVTMGFWR